MLALNIITQSYTADKFDKIILLGYNFCQNNLIGVSRVQSMTFSIYK
jgi:hypothetical protein